ncbi:MAG: DUF2795 domain-containing protein [Desmonostoc vinosum HA7617-LM4]|jgi:hypothetical protein|nr:DUF2795 domain-containing protein [Desmonostoc vinosum HA7617-LM4]
MAKVNSVQLQKSLNEINYPLNKEDLLRYAEEKGIDEGILRAFKQLPAKQYQSSTDVSQSIKEIVRKTVNPVQLEKNLAEITYPLSKKDLLKYAEEKGIDELVLRALKRLPIKQYDTLADISKAISESE